MEGDTEYSETTIGKVEGEGEHGWAVTWSGGDNDGWCFFIRREWCPFTPEVGMAARLYGKGIGAPVRGLVVNGHCCYYRTPEGDDQHRADMLYGKDAADLLRKWDAGDTCHTIEMGGLGPGYEQALQIAAFEILRHLLATQPDVDLWQDSDVWKQARDEISDAVTSKPPVSNLGLSGAQWGAALGLATAWYERGPQAVLTEVDRNRHTMVSKHFPSAA